MAEVLVYLCGVDLVKNKMELCAIPLAHQAMMELVQFAGSNAQQATLTVVEPSVLIVLPLAMTSQRMSPRMLSKLLYQLQLQLLQKVKLVPSKSWSPLEVWPTK